jgi:hypothetical protein
MKILQRFLIGIGTVLLLALSLQLVAPKAVHAVVSTLVTLANTSANPVASRNVDNAATYPFSANLCINVNSFCDPSLSQVFVVPATTSTGGPVKRLVLQGASGNCQGDPATIALLDGIQISSFAPEDTINPPSGPYRFYQIASRRILRFYDPVPTGRHILWGVPHRLSGDAIAATDGVPGARRHQGRARLV